MLARVAGRTRTGVVRAGTAGGSAVSKELGSFVKSTGGHGSHRSGLDGVSTTATTVSRRLFSSANPVSKLSKSHSPLSAQSKLEITKRMAPGNTLLLQYPSPFLRRLHTPVMPGGSSGANMTTRLFSIYSIPKFFAKVIRVPAAAASTVVGGAAYVSYKVQEASSYTVDKLHQASDMITGAFSSAKSALENIELPDFSLGEFWDSKAADKAADDSESSSGNGGNGQNSSSGGGGGGEEGNGAGAAALAAGVALGVDDETNPDGSMSAGTEDQMMVLTKKMIEIRSILQRVDQSDTLQLPSIVVIGSQSSGKSSVLEAIVGHEFLPKGSNMVTRRPIELTLINTPDSAAEYGEFPALGIGKVTDFSQIQKTLTDLNLSVPDSEAVSDEPIQLHIYSPHIPDLTLIDLPGYIQVAASDQPGSLKQRINELCEKYIQQPNVILAISAADVDLANSSALKASRRVDPRGERTIGVITKMDLVDPDRGYDVLTNKSYPLKMGYVGVITRAPTPVGGLFRRSSNNITTLVSQNEQNFFSQHPEYKDAAITVGTSQLRRKLMTVLEKTMANSLEPTCESIHQELEEATYQFKVEYNDRVLTPQTYLAGSVDSFKLAFKDLTSQLGRDQVRKLLKSELDQKVLDILAQRYWNKPLVAPSPNAKGGNPSDLYTVGADLFEPPISELPNSAPDDVFWHRKLDASASALTKLGMGRLSTSLVINELTNEMDELVAATNFRNHPYARNAIQEATADILNMRFYSTADQVENCIKPYKYEVEVEDREWTSSREHSYNLLKEELRQCEATFATLKRNIGSSKLTQVMKFVDQTRPTRTNKSNASTPPHPPPEGTEAFGFSQALLTKGREAVFLRDRADILKLRMAAVKSRQCKSKENKYYCPEVFLDVVAEKLTQTAVLFLNVELLSDFYYNFPRELDNRLGKSLTEEQVEAFAKQDVKIRRHIELQQRKELLELALSKIESVIELQKSRVKPDMRR
ncbi:dynamin-related GTPase MGM1 [Sugiyamaella lignohabitans]|uniref:dynamin GTPase n=1 Tax=Sugiyamaella lignohabitans TaxID=796027 RepID=A0A161HH50_9ASCO|nr:dynamin-related GTPase MGM1 [Sugiyamaella lignohabitans]ANB11327.1 dynamin-related GTPase MGM1 [Sugiyamaella lignohabitans]